MKEFKLPRKPFERWINLLRNNNFEQSIVFLHPSPQRYCALGLFCLANDIAIADNGEETLDEEGNCVSYQMIYKKLNLNFDDKNFVRYTFRLNDTKKLSFSQIADELEENVEVY